MALGDTIDAIVINTSANYIGCVGVWLENGQEYSLPLANISPNILKETIRNGDRFSLFCYDIKNGIPDLVSQEIKNIRDKQKNTTFADQLILQESIEEKEKEERVSEYDNKLLSEVIKHIKIACTQNLDKHCLVGCYSYDCWSDRYEIALYEILPQTYEANKGLGGAFRIINASLFEKQLKQNISALGFDSSGCYLSPVSEIECVGYTLFREKPKYEYTGSTAYMIVIDISW